MAAAGFPLSRPIASEPELVDYFLAAGKPRDAWQVGIEQEKIGVRDDGRPVPYDGPAGVAELLRLLEARGFAPAMQDGHVIALDRGSEQITVEPGGQIELSGSPEKTGAACAAALYRHLAEVQPVARELGIWFIAAGFRPWGALHDVPWLPKRRYAVMRSYLPAKGRLAHEMMKRTATVQANLDFETEADATDKLRTAFAITSIVTAMFAASPIREGQATAYKSYRAAVWLETDEDRCGILPFALSPAFAFADYVQWALDVPMFFVLRGGDYRPTGGITFRRFLRQGLDGERATVADWELHLSTLFPEVRLKRTIEVRGADAAPLACATALAPFWRGILDDADARRAAFDLVASASMDERQALRRAVPGQGLTARLAGRPLAAHAVDLCCIAGEGLGRLPDGNADRALLAPLQAYAEAGRCPADDMLDDFNSAGGDPAQLVRKWEIRV